MPMNVSLTRELEEFVHNKVKAGRYQTASEVVREGLRLLEEEDKRKSFSFGTRAELETKLLEGVRQLDRKEGHSASKVLKQLRAHSEKRRRAKHA
jgi:antitoxin ParD1/3/4